MLKGFAGGAIFGERVGEPPPAVIALHGWGRTRADLLPILEGLPGLALDLPGFGSSPPPPEAWGAAEYAGLVARVIEEACRAPAVVVGHSFGGRVATCLAASRPDLVRALVLTGAPLVRQTARRPPLRFRVARRLRALGLLSEARLERARQRYGSADYRAASGVMRAVLVRVVAESYEEELARVQCPVELVWGDGETEVPLAVAQAAAARLAHGRLTVVPGIGHDLPRADPVALRRAIDVVVAGASA